MMREPEIFQSCIRVFCRTACMEGWNASAAGKMIYVFILAVGVAGKIIRFSV